MAYQAVFKRYELKYLISDQQKQAILEAMEPQMAPDRFGRTTVRNIYFDTDTYLLARRSMEKPVYKEKLRLRSYGRAEGDSEVFVEIKKKYDAVVYKRRVSMGEEKAMAWLTGTGSRPDDSQISREIDYLLDLYAPLRIAAFLSYDREAYFARDGGDFRVTFDERILSRREEMSLRTDPWGIPLLEEGKTLMEIKSAGGIPLWMCHALTREGIVKTSFSKYGTAYQKLIYPNLQGGLLYA